MSKEDLEFFLLEINVIMMVFFSLLTWCANDNIHSGELLIILSIL